MNINLELFFSFVFAVFMILFFGYEHIHFFLEQRRKNIMKRRILLKKDMRFAKLDRKKEYIDYYTYQQKLENWKSDAVVEYERQLKNQCSKFEKELLSVKQEEYAISRKKLLCAENEFLNDVIEDMKSKILHKNYVELSKLIDKCL